MRRQPARPREQLQANRALVHLRLLLRRPRPLLPALRRRHRRVLRLARRVRAARTMTMAMAMAMARPGCYMHHSGTRAARSHRVWNRPFFFFSLKRTLMHVLAKKHTQFSLDLLGVGDEDEEGKESVMVVRKWKA